MFRIKVCGVTRPQDAAHAVACGADAIGLNFYEKSPRYLTPPLAAEVADACGDALVVGVFVNETAERISQIAAQAKLTAIQLHGDEPADFPLALPDHLPVIRAIRLQGETGLAPVAQDAERLAASGRPYSAVLVDAAGAAGEYGGTGQTADWGLVARERTRLTGVSLILAGGLGPENVAAAIEQTGAQGVDTASGVESAPGVKDPQLVRAFAESAAAALASR